MSSVRQLASASVEDAPILIPDGLVSQESQVTSSKVYTIRIGGEDYEFAQEHVDEYPNLLLPSTRFILGFKPCYKIILGLPVSTISKADLDEPSERELFLSACAALDIKLEPAVIIHISSDKKKQLEEISAKIQKKSSKEKMLFYLKKSVQRFAEGELAAFPDMYSDGMAPIKIIQYLELGAEFLDKLIIHDFREGRGVVSGLIDKFLRSFFL